MAVEHLADPGLVRMLETDPPDQVAIQIRNGWWTFEDPLPLTIAALAESDNRAFYDVGGNTGFYSLLVGRVCPDKPTTCFEPVPRIAELARRNLAAQGLDIEVVELGLSDSDGSALMHFPPEDHGLVETSATLNPAFFRGLQPVARTETVATSTLDHFNASQGSQRVGLIKIDVEGHEGSVIAGARGVARRDRPIIAVELLPGTDSNRISEFCHELAYRILAVRPGLVIQEEPSVGYIPDSPNQLLVPNEVLGPTVHLLEETGRLAAGGAAEGQPPNPPPRLPTWRKLLSRGHAR